LIKHEQGKDDSKKKSQGKIRLIRQYHQAKVGGQENKKENPAVAGFSFASE
jgi:hypothetical protein